MNKGREERREEEGGEEGGRREEGRGGRMCRGRVNQSVFVPLSLDVASPQEAAYERVTVSGITDGPNKSSLDRYVLVKVFYES